MQSERIIRFNVDNHRTFICNSLNCSSPARDGESSTKETALVNLNIAFDFLVSYFSTRMNSKNRKTFTAIFQEPIRSDINWADIESLFKALGAHISEGRGSRVRVALNSIRAVFHRPHPKKITDKGALKSVRRFLLTAGVENDL